MTQSRFAYVIAVCPLLYQAELHRKQCRSDENADEAEGEYFPITPNKTKANGMLLLRLISRGFNTADSYPGIRDKAIPFTICCSRRFPFSIPHAPCDSVHTAKVFLP